MSLFNVSAQKERLLLERMKKLGVSEKDIEETFVRSSGPGGQKVNKSSSCVFIRHIPTGLSVKYQRERRCSIHVQGSFAPSTVPLYRVKGSGLHCICISDGFLDHGDDSSSDDEDEQDDQGRRDQHRRPPFAHRAFSRSVASSISCGSKTR